MFLSFAKTANRALVLLSLLLLHVHTYADAFVVRHSNLQRRALPVPQRRRSSTRCRKTTKSSRTIHMGMKVTVRIVGRKNSEPWMEEAYSKYEVRLRAANVEMETVWHKTDEALIKGIDTDRAKNAAVVLLDPEQGREQSSEKFADNVYQWLEQGGSRLTFAIGGAEGLPAEIRYPSSGSKKQQIFLSLSKLTFTHQFARLVLIEQIYRASEIRKGSNYHK